MKSRRLVVAATMIGVVPTIAGSANAQRHMEGAHSLRQGDVDGDGVPLPGA